MALSAIWTQKKGYHRAGVNTGRVCYRVGKAGSTGSAEPIFFLILCQICPAFSQIVTNLQIVT